MKYVDRGTWLIYLPYHGESPRKRARKYLTATGLTLYLVSYTVSERVSMVANNRVRGRRSIKL